ncbi:hypothetical protein [Crenobacter intestini]|uniref:Uncharacterized protein n=1 Tax=Crenobacter intestini TaxID=2563443 RepID=A0A4T0URZ2_9NEIS|nr:hypothetical protein [Crenobacter intestini]TIC81366.1 hypothetical protein E5K04_10625 [Crenobacter intestini]
MPLLHLTRRLVLITVASCASFLLLHRLSYPWLVDRLEQMARLSEAPVANAEALVAAINGYNLFNGSLAVVACALGIAGFALFGRWRRG